MILEHVGLGFMPSQNDLFLSGKVPVMCNYEYQVSARKSTGLVQSQRKKKLSNVWLGGVTAEAQRMTAALTLG